MVVPAGSNAGRLHDSDKQMSHMVMLQKMLLVVSQGCVVIFLIIKRMPVVRRDIVRGSRNRLMARIEHQAGHLLDAESLHKVCDPLLHR